MKESVTKSVTESDKYIFKNRSVACNNVEMWQVLPHYSAHLGYRSPPRGENIQTWVLHPPYLERSELGDVLSPHAPGITTTSLLWGWKIIHRQLKQCFKSVAKTWNVTENSILLGKKLSKKTSETIAFTEVPEVPETAAGCVAEHTTPWGGVD